MSYSTAPEPYKLSNPVIQSLLSLPSSVSLCLSKPVHKPAWKSLPDCSVFLWHLLLPLPWNSPSAFIRYSLSSPSESFRLKKCLRNRLLPIQCYLAQEQHLCFHCLNNTWHHLSGKHNPHRHFLITSIPLNVSISLSESKLWFSRCLKSWGRGWRKPQGLFLRSL